MHRCCLLHLCFPDCEGMPDIVFVALEANCHHDQILSALIKLVLSCYPS